MDIFKSFLVVSMIIFIACEKEPVEEPPEISDSMPGKHIVDMAIDNNNEFFYITAEIDTRIDVPGYSSYMPIRLYLSKRSSETGDYEILDNDFIAANEIMFDRKNNLWARNSKKIYRKEGSTFRKVLELDDDAGLFNFFSVDKSNNIWAGGFTHGLYKIDDQLKVELYTSENSPLPKSSMTSIHIDENNNRWISMDEKGVLKITSDEWTWHNPATSDLTSQRIWSLTTDWDGNLWIGTGADNLPVNLMKYDGQHWHTVKPIDGDGYAVTGAIRILHSFNGKLYVVTEQTKNAAFQSNQLLVYDGSSWEQIIEIPEDDGIADLVWDEARQVVWVRTLNEGIFKIPG